MTYTALSLIFLAVAALVLALALIKAGGWRRGLAARWRLPIAVAGTAVMILTAVFDNVMIGSGLMTYASKEISGLRIGAAPLEDFAYPLAGLILLPALWLLLGRRDVDGR